MKTSEAIELFGTGSALAKALGISPSAVYQWGEQVPELRVFQIQHVLQQRSIECRDLQQGTRAAA